MILTRGIDVSDVQSARIDWAGITKQGVAFTYHRCGNMNDAPDPNFAVRIKEAHDAGLLCGAYAVAAPIPVDPAHPGREPEVQAKNHYEQCGGLGSGAGELKPMLDLEYPVPGSADWKKFGCTASFVRQWTLTYLEVATSLWGVKPVLYDGFPDFWIGIDGSSEPKFAEYDLWVVDYPAMWSHTWPSDDNLLVIPRPWTKWTLWQANGGGCRLPDGVPVDGDVFCGDLTALQAFACGRQAAA
jgi:GH25 family lysozyme M1 (1,4-beta-N-acetylmuramidase)